jgi:SAM-dependent methyltransferase
VELSNATNTYDELPYASFPIEWTAPERLALASLLHGGPRPPLDTYTVLELGCGDGANLLPLAYYRRHATFVGVDGARSRIEVANLHKAALGLSNLSFIHADFSSADHQLSGRFDYIIAHGVLSWVPHHIRDALLELCARRLHEGGLLYLNYNTKPGWNVRGMVREFLRAQTAGTTSLRLRAQLAQDVAAKIISSMTISEHPYSLLMANEFRLVCESHVSYVAHEYLAADNHAYWRSEFLALARRHGLEHVADADFCYDSGRLQEDLPSRLQGEQITGRTIDDTVDLLCYRQLHSPILTHGPLTRQPPGVGEFANLLVASCLVPCPSDGAGNPMFRHPSGCEVEAMEEVMATALKGLQPLWPRGLRVGAVFPEVGQVVDDLKLLQRSGLIELRCVEPAAEFEVRAEPLRRLESGKGGYFTTLYHTRDAATTQPGAGRVGSQQSYAV